MEIPPAQDAVVAGRGPVTGGQGPGTRETRVLGAGQERHREVHGGGQVSRAGVAGHQAAADGSGGGQDARQLPLPGLAHDRDVTVLEGCGFGFLGGTSQHQERQVWSEQVHQVCEVLRGPAARIAGPGEVQQDGSGGAGGRSRFGRGGCWASQTR